MTLRVLAIPAHLEGSGYLRICAPAQAVNKLSEGQVQVSQCLANALPCTVTGEPGKRRVEHMDDLDVDVVVLQSPMAEDVVAMIHAIKAQGISVVADIDDDLEQTPRSNPNWSKVHHTTSPQSNWLWLKKGCAAADLVTGATAGLSRYARPHNRFRVIPNAVPAAATYEKRPDIPGSVIVGWTGSVATHDTDLCVTGGGVAKAVERTGSRFLSIGWWHHVAEQLGLTFEPPSTGWLTLAQYYARIPYLGVGIVPLGNTAFNRAKSCLKGTEMAAAGVPFVASPLPEYQALHDAGIGLLAETPSDWEAQVRRLIVDTDLRTDLSDSYRDTIRRTRTFETTWWRWAEAWQHAADTRGGARGTA